MQMTADAAWSSFESVTTVWTGGRFLLVDQAVKTPTKPAVTANAIALSGLNTLGSFRRVGVGNTVQVLLSEMQ
jgi:hypothetical protein